MSILFDEIIAFGKAATANMAKTLQEGVKLLKEEPDVSQEERVIYARLLREQADLCLAAAEELEKE